MTAFRLAQPARAEFQAGLPNGTIDFPLQLHLQALQAELDLGPSPAERVKVWEQIVEVARIDEWVSERRFKAGRIPVQEHEASRYQYLDAKIHLLEAKQEAAKGGRK